MAKNSSKSNETFESKLAYKMYYNFSDKQLEIINEISYHTSSLYNIINYEMLNNTYKNYFENEKLYKINYHSNFLCSHNYQQCLKVLDQNWKSFFEALQDFKKNPSKYNGQPRRPGFKSFQKGFKNEIVYTKNCILGCASNNILKNDKISLTVSKEIKNKFGIKSLDFDMKNVKMPKCFNFNTIQQIRIAYDKKLKKFYFIFIYKVNDYIFLNRKNKDIMSIDLGLNNLETIVFNKSKETFIIDGKILKSKQSFINKQISILQSKEMKRLKNSKNYKDTRKIKSLRKQYNNFVKDYIHKCSSLTIKLALKQNCKTIVIGNFKGIKSGNKAKLFVKIPHTDLINQIRYKAKIKGIKVILVNEAYTSGCSILDNEEVNKTFYKKSRRISRGMFKTNNGFLINADVNGAYNILKKYVKTNPICLSKLIAKNVFLTSVSSMGNGIMTVPGLAVCQPSRLKYNDKINLF